MLKSFSDFLASVDIDKIEYDVLDANFSEDEYAKVLAEFTPEQFRYIFRISKVVSLAYLRQYDAFLQKESNE